MTTRPSITKLSSTFPSLSLINTPARRTVYAISPRKKHSTPSTIIRVAQLNDRHSTPPYPYKNGLKRFYKQQNLGLYGGLSIRTGHNVSDKTETKTRRAWRPNIQHKRLWSHALGKFLHLKVATRVLRTIDKSGGLDDYLLGEKRARIEELGMHGWLLRWRIMQTPLIQRRFAEERRVLGERYGVVLENPLQRSRDVLLAIEGAEGSITPTLVDAEESVVDENGEVISVEERDAKVAAIDRDLDRAMLAAEREKGQLAEDRSFMSEEPAPKEPVQLRQ